ncbi:MAG: hypothetical protein AB1736_02175 [Chloroflexota bacterium]
MNQIQGNPLDEGLNVGDAVISGGAGVIAGPIGGLSTVPMKLLAGAAAGCGADLVSQTIGNRQDKAEGAVACGFGAVGAVLPGNTVLQKAIFGTITAIAQGVATYLVGQEAMQPLGVGAGK